MADFRICSSSSSACPIQIHLRLCVISVLLFRSNRAYTKANDTVSVVGGVGALHARKRVSVRRCTDHTDYREHVCVLCVCLYGWLYLHIYIYMAYALAGCSVCFHRLADRIIIKINFASFLICCPWPRLFRDAYTPNATQKPAAQHIASRCSYLHMHIIQYIRTYI